MPDAFSERPVSSAFASDTLVKDTDRVAVLQVAVVALGELLRQQAPAVQGRWLDCLQQTRDLPENLPLSAAFDELLAMVDQVQRG